MGKHDALVSGSFAVQFFERLTWKKSDLDIFIEQGSGALAFEQYLCEREGYRFSREGGDEAYHAMSALVKVSTTRDFGSSCIGSLMMNSIQVRTLVMQRADSTEAQVQIVYTTHQPLLEILNGFYTTLVVNLISWNKAYAVYPQPSFLYHKTYLLKPMSDYFGKLLAKYEERGWRSQDVLWPEDEASHGSMGESRRLGDRFTWIISLDTRGVNRCDTPDSVLDYAGFGLGKRKNAALEYYQTDARRFSALTLKYRYIFPENRSEFWFRFLGPRMDRITLMELYKIPSASRSQLIQYAMQDRRERLRLLDDELAQCGIQLPSYDHVIPGWYAEWEKQQASQVEETSAQLHSYRYSMQPSLSFSPSTY